MIPLVFLVFLLINGYSNALTDEEVKINFIRLVMKCLKTHPVELMELTKLQSLIVPQKTEVKCLLSCAYKLDGLMSVKGLYDLDHAYKVAELSKNGDEKRLENGRKMSEECVKVNDIKMMPRDTREHEAF